MSPKTNKCLRLEPLHAGPRVPLHQHPNAVAPRSTGRYEAILAILFDEPIGRMHQQPHAWNPVIPINLINEKKKLLGTPINGWTHQYIQIIGTKKNLNLIIPVMFIYIFNGCPLTWDR